jgi:hypothetical protein
LARGRRFEAFFALDSFPFAADFFEPFALDFAAMPNLLPSVRGKSISSTLAGLPINGLRLNERVDVLAVVRARRPLANPFGVAVSERNENAST